MKENILNPIPAYQDDLTTVERLKSMLLDDVIICFTVLPIFMIPLIIADITESKWVSNIISLILVGIYLHKDSLGGRSAAKRILGQIVINADTGEPASEVRCVVRNFTTIIWIFEVIVVLFIPSKRLGDFVANTKVVRTEKEDVKKIFQDIKDAEKSELVLSFGIAVLYILGIIQILTP